MFADGVIRVSEALDVIESEGSREWLTRTHARLAMMLPQNAPRALLTQDMTRADGSPANVWSHFRIDPKRLHTVWANFSGIVHTAQAAQHPAEDTEATAWAGFEDYWIPVDGSAHLSGRLGLARDDGRIRYADCIVLLPGILGAKDVKRTRDIARALQDAGYHVLALDLRGLGATGARDPSMTHTFGALETGDLLRVGDWLESQAYVRHCGLIGFCWGANQALQVAWEDGRAEDDPDVGPQLRRFLPPRSARRHYQAGIIAFSPVLRFEEIISQTARPWAQLENPILHGLQKRVYDRMAARGYPNASGDLWQLIRAEIDRSALSGAIAYEEGLRYLRLMSSEGKPAGPKLEKARVPVLVVHGANDPLAPAQDVADFFSTLRNPNVAGVILPGGGHDGFAPYARDYFYSLILNFFDAHSVALVKAERRLAATGRQEVAAFSSMMTR